jgi:hypothetical protein
MRQLRLSRRAMLSAVGAGIASAAWLVSCTRASVTAKVARNALAEPLVALLHRRRVARELGRAYLWTRDPRPDRQELVDQVLSLEEQRGLADAPRWKLRQVVRSRIEQEYGRGRPVAVAGWLLSETEASLCALTVDDTGDSVAS